MKLVSFKELALFLLSDMYAVENELVVELPKFIKHAYSEELKEALRAHLAETKVQVRRLERIFKLMHEQPRRVEWASDIRVLLRDADKFIKNNNSSPLLDAAIIVICQRIEHFEIATYGTLREFAAVMENDEVKDLIKETLKEEVAADATLTRLAKGGIFTSGINLAATHH